MRKILLASIAALGVTAAASAQDADSGPYLGAGLTHLDADFFSATGITLLGGVDINEYFAVEGEVFIGLDGEDASVGNISASIDVNYGFGGYAKVQYPLTENFSIHGRAGYASYEVDASANIPGFFAGSGSETFDGFAWGGGAQASFNGPNAIRFDYTRYEISELDDAGFDAAYTLTLSYVRGF